MRRMAIAVVMVLSAAGPVAAYPVGPAIPLEEMVAKADVILKAKVLSSKRVNDNWFKNYRGWAVFATRMRVIDVVKGPLAEKEIVFHHYDTDPDHKDGYDFLPQVYKFTAGRSYLVFAAKTERPGVLRQMWLMHRSKEDQGAILAADDQPAKKGQPIKEILWSELTGLLDSDDSKDVQYAVKQLHEMSAGDWRGTRDLDRQKVLATVVKKIDSRDRQVASEALKVVGSLSPYRSDGEAHFWLATIGKGSIRGLSKRDANVDNAPGRTYRKELISVADSQAAAQTRALAIRALGRSGAKELGPVLKRWQRDAAPQVRHAAALLWADLPVGQAGTPLTELSKDSNVEVRVGAAHAVGFGQFTPLLGLLDRLLKDDERKVRTAAALSLLSFDVKDSGKILKAYRNDPDFKSVFVNALAEVEPEPYLDDLAEIIEKRMEPHDFWSGESPPGRSGSILLDYLKGQDRNALTSGKFDRHLIALQAGGQREQFQAFLRKRGLTEYMRLRGKG